MKVPAIFVAAVLLTFGNVCTSSDVKALSQNAKPGEFPFLVTFNVRYLNMPCAGSIISDRWILTSASCIIKPRFAYFNFVVAGRVNDYANQVFADKIRVNDTRLFTHEQFHPITFENDIGLILLPRSYTFNRYLKPIKIIQNGYSPPNTALFYVIGWGDLGFGSLNYNGIKYSTVPVRDNSACETELNKYTCPTYSFFDKKIKTILCSISQATMGTGLTGYVNVFGGPLVFRNADSSQTQIGITSWASNLGSTLVSSQTCSKDSAIVAYTDLALYSDWIQDIITYKNSANYSALSLVLFICSMFANSMSF